MFPKFLSFVALLASALVGICTDIDGLLAQKDEIVVYPKTALVLATNSTMVKFDRGINITYNDLFNVELEGAKFFNGSTWAQYDTNLEWVADLSEEYVQFLGILEFQLQVPLLQDIIAGAKERKKREEQSEHISYEDYLSQVFAGEDLEKRGLRCIYRKNCEIGIHCDSLYVPRADACRCYGSCLNFPNCPDSVC